ncbi:hypothetical protein IM266_19220 [Enterobacter cloacae complex sp. P30BA]|uniref:hypothetical protein n=1 Tax=Enterobacter cloacae complex sp. P30BA TaxID=2779562 RepID=UPI0018681E81|nr:hypothetical protein [Enterobacter cloacae complex sp. P30BA]MBE3153595.1 hypothetical protein [Enterobacter cloacae complex sp. P30BA]
MTETVEANQPDEQDGTFDRNYTEVKRLKVLVADDGTKIPFSANMKVVYAYLYTFQTNKERRNYPEPIHPNMEIIAWENGITKPTAQKAVDDLMRAGVLIKDQIQVGSGFKSNNYVVLKPSKVVARGVTPPHPNASKYSTAEESGKNEQKRAVVEPAAPAAGKSNGVPVVDIPVDDALPVGDNAPLSGPAGENIVEFPHSGRAKLSFKFVSPDGDDQENYSEPPQVDFDKDGQPPNKWKDFDMATTCDFL